MGRPRTNMASCECAICYSEAGPFRKLCCGHEFCGGCIKQWYAKGAAGTSCPMCRRSIYFRGFHSVRDEWDEEHWRERCIEIVDEYRTERIAEAFECFGEFGPVWDAVISRQLMADLKDLDRMTRFLMDEGIAPDWLEHILYETDAYYSDRNVGKFEWADAPAQMPATRYPKVVKSGAKGVRRARARQDAWFALPV